MYQEREVNEHALRVLKSWVRCAMIISTISCGKRGVDPWVTHLSAGAFPSRRLTLVLLRRQTVAMRAEMLIPNVTRRRGQSEIRELVGEAILDVEDTGLIVRPLPLASGTPSWW